MLKKINQIGEFGLIERIRKKLNVGANQRFARIQDQVIRGIGDDAAVLPYTKNKYLLLTTDMMAEDVHFMVRPFDKLRAMQAHHKARPATPQEIGHKALACNMSDIAAMGGVPTYAVVAIGLPKNLSVKYVEDMYEGMQKLAKTFGVSIVGGDTIKSNQIVINVALLGQVEKKYLVTRSGAKAGDWIFVTGALGGSLQSGKHLHFIPRLAAARFLVRRFKPSAMIDISDGLAGDLNHILKASRVGALLWEKMIPRSKVGASRQGGTVPLQEALTNGEDYELLFTLSVFKARQLLNWQQKGKQWFFYPIGRITNDRKQLIPTKSFTHF